MHVGNIKNYMTEFCLLLQYNINIGEFLLLIYIYIDNKLMYNLAILSETFKNKITSPPPKSVITSK